MGSLLDLFYERQSNNEDQVYETQVEPISNYVTSSTDFTGTDFSLKDKIETVKTEKFKIFEQQLNALKNTTNLNLLACYQAAVVTSGISLTEINENITVMKEVVNSTVNIFKNKCQFEISEFEQETNSKISISEKEVEELSVKIRELNDEVNHSKDSIIELKRKKEAESNEFENSANVFLTGLSSLEKEVEINLGGAK